MGIQNEEIKGSLAIGRDLVTGGGITSRGHSVFDKNVIVKGVLYAKNIKGPCLGLFSSVEQIKKYYPKAREGSYALIGTTIPAEVWHVVDGTWVFTGEKSGEISVDLIDYLTKEEALAEYSTKEELETTQNRCTELLQELEKELSKTIKEGDSALQSTLQVVQTAIAALRGDKQDKLAPGRGIAISGNVISCTLDTSLYKVVVSLPESGEENKIYLVESNEQGEHNIYTEYGYINGKWETLGQYRAEVNLTPYLTKDDAIKMYQPKGEYASQSDYDELSETVDLIDKFVGEHTNDRDIHITKTEKTALCIYPFDAIVYNPSEAYGKGYEIAYSVKLKQFISVANDSYTIKGGPYESRDNLYRIGGVLYKFENDTLVEIYQPKGEYASQTAFDELSETVTVIDELAGEHTNDKNIHITEVEKSALCIYPFDAVVYNPEEAYGQGYNIVYSAKLKQFVSIGANNYSVMPMPYNSSDYLYRKGAVLYKFENGTLAEYCKNNIDTTQYEYDEETNILNIKTV